MNDLIGNDFGKKNGVWVTSTLESLILTLKLNGIGKTMVK